MQIALLPGSPSYPLTAIATGKIMADDLTHVAAGARAGNQRLLHLLLDVTEAGTDMQAILGSRALRTSGDGRTVRCVLLGGADARRPLRSRRRRSRGRISTDSRLRSGQRIPAAPMTKSRPKGASRGFSGSRWSASVARMITQCPHFSSTANPCGDRPAYRTGFVSWWNTFAVDHLRNARTCSISWGEGLRWTA